MKRIKNIFLNNFISSLIFCVISFLICFILNDFRINTSVDDYAISLLIHEESYQNLYISHFLSMLLIPLQSLFGNVNIFVVVQIIMNIISYICIFMIIQRTNKTSKMMSLCISVAFSILFSSFMFVHIQWTLTATINSATGYLLLLFNYNENKKKRYICFTLGILLILYSSMLRFAAFLSASVVFIAYMFISFIVSVFMECRYDMKKDVIKKLFLKYLKSLICIILVFVSLFSIQVVSNNLKSGIDSYNEFKIHNEYRSKVVDNSIMGYEGNENFYNSLDIYSQNDLDFYKNWCLDSNFYTDKKLKSIVDASANSDLGLRFSVSYIFTQIINKISKITVINPYILLLLLGLIGCIICFILFKLRNKIKYFFPAILIISWLIFFYLFKINIVNYMALFIFILIAISVFFYNRYYYAIVSLMTIIIYGLYLYLYFTRPIFRSTFTFFLPAILLLFIIMQDSRYLRKSVSPLTDNRSISIFSCTVLLIISAVFGYNLWTVEVKRGDNGDVYNYMIENQDKIFVSDSWFGMEYCFNDGESAAFWHDIPDNVLMNGGWIENSNYYNQQKDRLNIHNVYEDLYKKDNVYYIIKEDYIDSVTEYINAHYFSEKQYVYFVGIKKLNNGTIYKAYIK